MKKYIAECIGTLVLTLMGCAAAVSLGCNNGDPETVIGTSLAFGLSVVAMAYAIGGISGCHINPAITLAVWLSGRMSGKDALGYWVGQFVGGIIAAAILFGLTSSTEGGVAGTGANDIQEGTTLASAIIAEIVFTCVFVFVVLGATSKTNGATNNLAGLAIGLTLVLVHLCCIRYTGTSVNPARSLGPALFQGGTALANVWIFIVAPFVGAALSALLWKVVSLDKEA